MSSPSEKTFCSCIPLEEISLEEIEDYNTILTGKVLKIDTLNANRIATVKVRTIYKGSVKGDKIDILTPVDLYYYITIATL